MRPSSLLASSLIRYLTSPSSRTPTPSIEGRLFGFTERGRSVSLPCLRNLGEKPAYGPYSNPVRPPMTRVSRCGTDIGGAPTAALPYTLARCWSMSSRLVHRRNSPLTGKPPKPLISSMADFCSRCRAPPPAPTKTNLALTDLLAPVRRLTTCTVQLPSDCFDRSRTSCPK